MRVPARFLALAALGTIAVATGGCTQLRGHQGYIVDADLVNSVQPGVDTRKSVLQLLGKPSFASQFDEGDWYYIGRDTRNYAFRNPHPTAQVALRIRFNQDGVVRDVTQKGMEQVAAITPYGKETPTLGRQRTFLQELFGNIGSVGAGGAGADTAGGQTQP